MNRCIIAARKLALPAVIALVAIGLGLWAANSTENAEAAPTELTAGLDMSSAALNGGTYNISSLPTFEQCLDVKTSVNSGFFYLDAFVLNMTNLIAFRVDINFTAGKLQILESDVEQFLGTSSSIQNQSRNSLSGTKTISPAVSDGRFHAEAVDTGGGGHSGSGVLARIKGQALIGSVVTFELNITPLLFRGVTLTDTAGNQPGDTNSDGFFDGPFINQTGTIAIDQPDGDGDGASNTCDNCPSTPNAAQTDTDGDGLGDACDGDMDGDGVLNGSDNCPLVFNPTQDPNACLGDDDNDGVLNGSDNCPSVANPGQEDFDNDGAGDACDPDDDNDGVLDGPDNCQFAANPGQANWDGDALGDACDDSDSAVSGGPDGWTDDVDNCRSIYNPAQSDDDGDGIGTVCDNCPNTPNPGQEDVNSNGIGNACDDSDGDGWTDDVELFTGTNANRKCAADTVKNNEAVDASPADTNDDRTISVFDLVPFITYLNTTNPRYDFNMNGIVNVLDVAKYIPILNTICVP
ncbi:MAG: thrombospondin type 3 repeat-containing protein [Gemmatimonadetes bacterium]|nr:thrombospondin type 3 repeat-containing protein [Gemmatimonadota bacterium]